MAAAPDDAPPPPHNSTVFDTMAAATAGDENMDPFVTKGSPAAAAHSPAARHPPLPPRQQRYSAVDSAQLLALDPAASPSQAKRVLEAHMAETERRMDEAGRLGTALVLQHKELAERLTEVELLQADDILPASLKQKLLNVEREYHDVARDSARALMPKQRLPSGEAASGSPFVGDGQSSRVCLSFLIRHPPSPLPPVSVLPATAPRSPSRPDVHCAPADPSSVAG